MRYLLAHFITAVCFEWDDIIGPWNDNLSLQFSSERVSGKLMLALRLKQVYCSRKGISRIASAQQATIKSIKANGNAARETMCIAQWAMHGQLLLPADEETLDKLARVSHSSIASHNWDEYISPPTPTPTSVPIGRKKLRGKGCNYLQESSSSLWVYHLNSCKNSLCKSHVLSDTLVKGEMDFLTLKH